MNLKQLVSRRTVSYLCRLNARFLSQCPQHERNFSSFALVRQSFDLSNVPRGSTLGKSKFQRPVGSFVRCAHSAQEVEVSDSEDDGTMTEFLSRFVWIMRGKLKEAYPDSDKSMIDGMLLVISKKVVKEIEKDGVEKMISGAARPVGSTGLSEDLWNTVWEVSSKVLGDMEKERKKEKLKRFLQDEEVKEMVRFAGEVGIRGDMLREFRFKWAREKMEESDFYESLEMMRENGETSEEEEEEEEGEGEGGEEHEGTGTRKEPEVVEATSVESKHSVPSLPKRKGKFKYKIYGLDLSDSKWAEVADKIHDANEVIWPQEPKPITGKCKLVNEKIFSLKEEDDPLPLLAEWKELLQPSRIDWMNLLEKLKGQNIRLYYKVADLLLSEESFQTHILDYSKLIDAHAKENRLEVVERLLKKMDENGISPDILIFTSLVHMYCKVGNLDRAAEAFKNLRVQGFRPDIKVYNSMITAYVNSGQPKLGETLMREMESRDIKPTEEIYMALLRSFAQQGDAIGAGKIATTMQLAGFQPSKVSCTLLVEAYGKAEDPDLARSNFDYMIKIGNRPDDRSVASMIAAYEKKNLLDKALNLLLVLQKDHGFEPGVTTYTVLVDWLGKLLLIDEAEQVVGKIAELGESPSLKIHVSLCDMYGRSGLEKKALQALGVVEAKKDELGSEDFERIIHGLIKGGFSKDAQRMHRLMEDRGFTPSERLKLTLMSSQSEAFKPKRPSPSGRR